MVRYLVQEQGADVDGNVPMAGHFPLWVALDAGHLNMVKLLISLGSGDQPRAGRGILAAAVRSRNVELVKYLLSISDTRSGGFISTNGAFHEAVLCTNRAIAVELMRLLLGSGKLDPSVLFDHDLCGRMTAFPVACTRRRLEVARLLLADERVDPNIRSERGRLLPIDMATGGHGATDGVAFLLEQPGIEYDPDGVFYWACRKKHHTIAKKVIENVDIIDADMMDRWMRWPKHCADLDELIAHKYEEDLARAPAVSSRTNPK